MEWDALETCHECAREEYGWEHDALVTVAVPLEVMAKIETVRVDMARQGIHCQTKDALAAALLRGADALLLAEAERLATAADEAATPF